jgi:hypothetical protein
VLVVLILALAGGGAFFVTQTEAGKKLVAGGGAGGGGNVAPPPVNGGPKSDPQPAFVPPPQVKVETKSIVGRWDVVRSGTQTGSNVAGYMRFNTDGTFTSTLAFLATTDGRYRTMSSTAIELDFPGVIYGRNQVEFLYRLSNDSLSLKDSKLSIDLEFRRVD